MTPAKTTTTKAMAKAEVKVATEKKSDRTTITKEVLLAMRSADRAEVALDGNGGGTLTLYRKLKVRGSGPFTAGAMTDARYQVPLLGLPSLLSGVFTMYAPGSWRLFAEAAQEDDVLNFRSFSNAPESMEQAGWKCIELLGSLIRVTRNGSVKYAAHDVVLGYRLEKVSS